MVIPRSAQPEIRGAMFSTAVADPDALRSVPMFEEMLDTTLGGGNGTGEEVAAVAWDRDKLLQGVVMGLLAKLRAKTPPCLAQPVREVNGNEAALSRHYPHHDCGMAVEPAPDVIPDDFDPGETVIIAPTVSERPRGIKR